MNPAPGLPILRWLASCTHAGASEIGIACRNTTAKVQTQLVTLEALRLVASHRGWEASPPQRGYTITAEWRRGAEILDARTTER